MFSRSDNTVNNIIRKLREAGAKLEKEEDYAEFVGVDIQNEEGKIIMT